MTEETVNMDVPGGPRLEGRLGRPAAPRGGLALCHPHPLYGGDMDNPVIIRTAEVARDAGLCTLRFNFRGVGASQGVHDNGRGEQADLEAALSFLGVQVPGGRPLGLCGYSFGAWVASRVARPGALVALCLIAPPVGMFDWERLDGAGLDVLLVAGTQDPYCAASDLERLAGRIPGARVVTIDGADHFFFGRLFPLGLAVGEWTRRWAS